jgi:hypothetical protein
VAPGSIFAVNTSWSFNATRARLNFISNNALTYEGVSLNQLQVCTYLSTWDTHPPATLDSKRRYYGVLLGSTDTVYLQFSATSTNHYPIALWEDGGGGHDFDLYARCGALPTPTQYDWIGFSGNDEEYIDVTGCTGTVYVAINSYNGAGPFSVIRGIHTQAAHSILRAGTEFSATPTEYSNLADTLQNAARHYYGSTEGEQIIAQIDLYNSGSCGSTSCGGSPCEICFRTAGGTANASCSGNGNMNVFVGYRFDPEGISHEFGHMKSCLGDEYVNGSQWQCGHSNMASPWGDNNNFCVDLDHKRDSLPGVTPTTYPSAMSQAVTAGRVVESQNTSLDNFDYIDFDFNGLVGNVISH